MAKGKRFPEEQKMQIAKRLWDGESTQAVAEELGVHYSTVLDWKSRFKPKRKVRRKVTVQPKENTGVSQGEIEHLKKEVSFWKDAFMDEFRKNRNDSGS